MAKKTATKKTRLVRKPAPARPALAKQIGVSKARAKEIKGIVDSLLEQVRRDVTGILMLGHHFRVNVTNTTKEAAGTAHEMHFENLPGKGWTRVPVPQQEAQAGPGPDFGKDEGTLAGVLAGDLAAFGGKQEHRNWGDGVLGLAGQAHAVHRMPQSTSPTTESVMVEVLTAARKLSSYEYQKRALRAAGVILGANT